MLRIDEVEIASLKKIVSMLTIIMANKGYPSWVFIFIFTTFWDIFKLQGI